MARDDPGSYLPLYAEEIAAPVETGTEVHRISRSQGGYALETNRGAMKAPAVVKAIGGNYTPHCPDQAADVPCHITQIHCSSCRNPEQLPDGDVLVVGTGQSGGQIAEELRAAGKGVHLAVSMCLEARRRARGHDVHLRDLARRGMHLCGHLERIKDGQALFTYELPGRLDVVESGFRKNIAPVIDAHIEAAAVEAPAAGPRRHDPRAATGYRLDFGCLDPPVLDAWNYPSPVSGALTDQPGPYALGLPWLTPKPRRCWPAWAGTPNTWPGTSRRS